MSFLRQANRGPVGNLGRSPFLFLTQIRTATKRVSGSRTNKNDSAGRRLGPKVYENHFVQPGQIIMRQRGSKIHPGENVSIGKDHTIFALEPGYVRFYLDPFHPLRKYVGVALKEDVTLPRPHFEPRLRRFGYNPLEGEEADREEAHMSRKEYLAQPELLRLAEKKKQDAAKVLDTYSKIVAKEVSGLSEEQVKDAASRLQFMASKIKAGEAPQFAAEQASYNYVFDLELAAAKGVISAEDLASKRAAYLELASDIDLKLSVDIAGLIYKTMTQEELAAAQKDARTKLEEYVGKVPTEEDKTAIKRIIATPGVFSRAERLQLKHTYLPDVLPVTVPGTVVEKPGKKLPKGAVTVRTFNKTERRIDTVVRTKDAFLA